MTKSRYISHAVLLLAVKLGKPTQFSKINQTCHDSEQYRRLTCLFSSALAKVRSCVNEKSRNNGKKRPLCPRSQPRNRMRCLPGSLPRMRYFKATSRRYGTISSHLLRPANKQRLLQGKYPYVVLSRIMKKSSHIPAGGTHMYWLCVPLDRVWNLRFLILKQGTV